MSNTYLNTIATLVTTLCHEGQRIAQSKLAPLNAYGAIFEIDPAESPGLDSEVAICTALPDVQVLAPTDTPNYLADGINLQPISCAHNLFIQPFTIENAYYQGGARMSLVAAAAMNNLCNAIVDKAKSHITTDNFGAAVVTAAVGAPWTQIAFATLAGSITSPNRAVVLDSPYAMQTPNTWLPASGNCSVYECSRWSTAGSNIVGFAATPEAMVFRHGVPTTSLAERRVIISETITLANLGGLKIEASVCMPTNTRNLVGAYRLFFAAAPADKSALKLLAKA